MAILEFDGPESAAEATESALTWRYSAVIVRGAITRLRNFEEWNSLPALKQERTVPIDITSAESGFPFDIVAQAASDWFLNHVSLAGINRLRQHFRNTKILPHCDSTFEQPFVMSVGLFGQGEWETQIASDEDASANRFNPASADVGFDENSDTFVQNAGDLVLVPGYNADLLKPSIHSVSIVNSTRRRSVVFRLDS